MATWPRGDYLEHATRSGIDPEVAERAWKHANKVQKAGLPAILSLKHLSLLTECTYESLRAIALRENASPYRTFRIKKRKGGFRRICVPKTDLLRVQEWIDQFILSRVPVHPNAKAYSNGSSTIECAGVHAGCKWLIKCDVQQFFESISEIQVYRAFESLGYEPLVSFQLARLCTRIPASRQRYKRENWKSAAHHKYTLFSHEHIGHLPQGAPTSPKLSNLVMTQFDEAITQIASRSDLCYTRYADDLIFSAFSVFDRVKARSLIGTVYTKMRETGLRPHTAKTTVIPPGGKKIVLGLCVNDTTVRLTREFKNELKTNVHFICRFGIRRQAENRKFESLIGFRNHIAGKLNYARQIEPVFVERLESQLNRTRDWNPESI